MQTFEIDARFAVERAEDVASAEAIVEVHNMVHLVALRLNELIVDGPEKAAALTALEESIHWADSAILRSGLA